jgi:hypothetical protein
MFGLDCRRVAASVSADPRSPMVVEHRRVATLNKRELVAELFRESVEPIRFSVCEAWGVT